MKLLVTGASGLFGSKLAKLAITRGIDVYSTDIQNLSTYGSFVKLDISEKQQVEQVIGAIKPDIIVHAASLTDVDKCETNKELAWSINVEGTRNIVGAAKKAGAFLIYISTDYVFSGEKGNYKETDKPDPINYYGLTKLKAEEIVQTQPEYSIARPSVMYGSTPAAGKVNFALWLIETLSKGECVKIVTDQWNTPTLNTNLAEMTLEVAERRLTGIYHLCGATRISRFEFATQIADAFELNKDLIHQVTSSEFTFTAKRPMDSSLDTSKALKIMRCKPMAIDMALEQLKFELTQNVNRAGTSDI